MLRFVELLIALILFCLTTISQAGDTPPLARQLDSIGGGEVIRRHPDEDGEELDFPASKALKALMIARLLDRIGGGNLIDALSETLKTEVPRSADGLLDNGALKSLMSCIKGTDAMTALDRMSDGALLKALEKIDGTQFLLAMDRAWHDDSNGFRSKRGPALDSITGLAFGESKRRFPYSSSLAKKNFDEIDNVGFNGWQKRLAFRPGHATNRIGGRILSLARRNFGGPMRGSSSLAKKNFDEIDRTGFEGFSKRSTK